MTDPATLHAIDVLYLDNFRQTLFHKVLDAQLELREHLKHAEALAQAVEISSDCRKQYAEIIQRLSHPVSVLGDIAEDMYDVDLSGEETGEPVQWGLIETIPEDETRAIISRLDVVEQESIKALNGIGEALTSLPAVKATWNRWARLEVYYKLKPVPERPCYKTDPIVRFNGSPPFHDAFCFAKPQTESELDPDSSYLLDAEFMPLIWLGMLDDVGVDIGIKIDNFGSREPHEEGVVNADKL